MQTQTKSRAYTEGKQSRRRNYLCRQCSTKFQVDTLTPLPEDARVCPGCRAESLNVKVANINIKRLSRLQAVILKVIYVSLRYHRAYKPRQLSQIVARLYGNGSVKTIKDKSAWAYKQMNEIKKENNPAFKQLIPALEEVQRTSRGLGITDRDEWLSASFSVAFSRSIRNLHRQGLIIRLEDDPGIIPTLTGIDRIEAKKIKVEAKAWDRFLLQFEGLKEISPGEFWGANKGAVTAHS